MYSVVILSGGKSSRMGTDKRLLLWHGSPLLKRLIDGFPECDDRMLSVCTVLENDPSEIRCVADIYPGSGPLAGIHAALAAMRHEILFVTSCDAPLVDARTAEAMFPYLAGYDAVVPRSEDGREHPLIALYRKHTEKEAEERLKRGERRMTAFAAALNTFYVPCEVLPYGELTVANLNTPSDIIQLEEQIERLQI